MADWSHYAEFFPFVVSSQLDEEAPAATDTVRVRQRIDLPFPFPDRRFSVATSWKAPIAIAAPGPGRAADQADLDDAYEATWSYVAGSGNIDHQAGRWRLWPLGPDRTLVELRLASDAGSGVPDALEARALAQTLPWALDGLRQQVNRCRYDIPRHPTCREAPPQPLAEIEPTTPRQVPRRPPRQTPR